MQSVKQKEIFTDNLSENKTEIDDHLGYLPECLKLHTNENIPVIIPTDNLNSNNILRMYLYFPNPQMFRHS